MPADLLSLSVIACEKVLLEHDGVPSAIRLLDLIFVDPKTDPEKRAPFVVSLLVSGRFKVGHNRDCRVNIELVHANGERTLLQEHDVTAQKEADRYPQAPNGFNLILQFGLIPKNLGTCFIIASVEDASAVAPLTFLEAAGQTPQ